MGVGFRFNLGDGCLICRPYQKFALLVWYVSKRLPVGESRRLPKGRPLLQIRCKNSKTRPVARLLPGVRKGRNLNPLDRISIKLTHCRPAGAFPGFPERKRLSLLGARRALKESRAKRRRPPRIAVLCSQ